MYTETCPYVPQVVERTEGHHTGSISLNSTVDLPNAFIQIHTLLKSSVFTHYLLKPYPYQNFTKISHSTL